MKKISLNLKRMTKNLTSIAIILIASLFLMAEDCPPKKKPCQPNCCEECFAHGIIAIEPCPALGLQAMPPFYYNPPNDPGLCRLEAKSPSEFVAIDDNGQTRELVYDLHVYSNFSLDQNGYFYKGHLSGALSDPGTTGWNGIFHHNLKVKCCQGKVEFQAKFCGSDPNLSIIDFKSGSKILTSTDCDKNWGTIYLRPYVGSTSIPCN